MDDMANMIYKTKISFSVYHFYFEKKKSDANDFLIKFATRFYTIIAILHRVHIKQKQCVQLQKITISNHGLKLNHKNPDFDILVLTQKFQLLRFSWTLLENPGQFNL